jgi:hypothetical protein
MQNKITLFLVVMVFTLVNMAATTAENSAGTGEKKTIIALKTGDFEMAETDISALQVGESETIVTDSGKTIDLLRTADGVEIYVDGELLNMEFGDEQGTHGEHHAMHKRVEVVCEAGDDCEKMVWISAGGDFNFEDMHASGEHEVISRTIRVECDGEEDCSTHDVFISDGGDLDIEALHEHGDDGTFVMIHKRDGDHDVEIIGDEEVDADSLEHDQKVIVIRKKVHKD